MSINTGTASSRLMKHKSHKVIEAGKILEVITNGDGSADLLVEDENSVGILIHVSDHFMAKHLPEKGSMYVVYEDGYASISPMEAFKNGYRPLSVVRDDDEEYGRLESQKGTFGDAIKALKNGRRVSRAGWNGKGLFVFMQVPSEIPDTVIPKMQSVPDSVKEVFVERGGSISYKNQLAMVYPDNSIYGWVASPSDVLEEDWGLHVEQTTNAN